MISENISNLNKRIVAAAARCDRQSNEISLVAVSKKKTDQNILEAYQAGQRIFGENYLQEAITKTQLLPKDITWHFIGHLQSNKAKLAAEHFTVIETVDRVKLARLLDTHAAACSRTLDVLIQINIGAEQQKSGIAPEAATALLEAIKDMPQLRAKGLMIIPPYNQDPEKSRPYFRELKKLSQSFAAQNLFYDNERVELSMGMSQDFEVAIEEGATIIRVGTALFGARTY
ncbi:YggS family pyridoxal phosphate-dependent enzyme [Desulfogranum japonicum]|uniref:YggS family pyridoxal phosphate-dependent enzyme n=1 Tax=Desulfogranum japonicum TaxID=231447 RepID=UPI00042511AC|nr:YggS family pyridoxal phosphate-dependent enzyme [Desulfogranum japonicum]